MKTNARVYTNTMSNIHVHLTKNQSILLTNALIVAMILLMSTKAYSGLNNINSDNCHKDKNCYSIAEAIYFEARGEGKTGMQAVANVIMNRTKSRKLTPYQVVNQKYQFSYKKNKNLKMSNKKYKKMSYDIAAKAINGNLSDITHGATYFRTKNSGTWGSKFKRTVTIKNHTFFKPK